MHDFTGQADMSSNIETPETLDKLNIDSIFNPIFRPSNATYSSTTMFYSASHDIYFHSIFNPPYTGTK